MWVFFFTDFLPALKQTEQWRLISTRNIKNLNRRSQLGDFWLVLSSIIFVSLLSLVYSAVFRISTADLLPYIAIGYCTWLMISGLVASMPAVFIAAKPYLSEGSFFLSTFAISLTYEKLSVFLWQLIAMFLFTLFFGIRPSFEMLVIPLSLIISAVMGVGMSFILGSLGTRYRDVSQIINSILLLIFLTTPILWKSEFLGNRAFLADMNPVFHFIEIYRSPILDANIPITSLLFTAVLAIFVFFTGLLTISKYRFRIIFWI